MESRAKSSMAIGLGLVFWICLLFTPLAFVQTVRADDVQEYGTVIGIVSRTLRSTALVERARADHFLYRILEPHTAVSV